MLAAAAFGQALPATPEKEPSRPSNEAPPEVDAALRARVSQFFQFEVQGKFNQALQLVAEDTKDAFVGSAKPTYTGFTMNTILYSDDFTKASVMVLVDRMLPIQGFMGHPLPTKVFSRWKLENGQWCYYVDPEKDMNSSPFRQFAPPGMAPKKAGAFPPIPPPSMAAAGVPVPPSGTPAPVAPPGMAAPGMPVPAAVPPGGTPTGPHPLPPMPKNLPDIRALTVDKPSVQLKASGPSSEQVVISNPSPWTAVLTLSDPKVAGLTVKLDPLTLRQGQKAILSLQSSGDVQIPKTPLTVAVRVTTTNQIIPIKVSFAE